MYSKKHCAAKLITCVFKEKYRNEENRGKYKKRSEQSKRPGPIQNFTFILLYNVNFLKATALCNNNVILY